MSTTHPEAATGRRHYTHEEWHEEARRRFGESSGDWQFLCPACGNVQTPRDFEAVSEHRGQAADRAPQYCIGNFTDHDCDWKSFGLFRGPVYVDMGGGHETPVFDFAPMLAEAEAQS